jgi:hypothetical protein
MLTPLPLRGVAREAIEGLSALLDRGGGKCRRLAMTVQDSASRKEAR